MIALSVAAAPASPRPAPRAATTIRLALALVLVACARDRRSSASGAAGDSARPSVAAESAGALSRAEPDSSGIAAGDRGIPDSATSAAGAVAVITEYYAAISSHRLHDAYHLWADNGAATNQTFEEFARGYDDTRTAKVAPGPPGRIEGAAGARYVEIPLTIDALATSGEHRRFTGSYLLRRAVVSGATPEQRNWHIYSAQIRPVE